ncbi:MAG: hypothetical protein WA065_09640, partial [Trichococcus flocculiformis]
MWMTSQYRTYRLHLQNISKMKSTLLPKKWTSTSIIAITSPGRWRQVFSCASWGRPAFFSASTLLDTEMVGEA